jgi:hypothetical protein
MIKLVKQMENYVKMSKFKDFTKFAESHYWDSEIQDFIDYSKIDFANEKHRETFLELDFVWEEISCSGKDSSPELHQIYGFIQPAMMILALKYSSDPKQQERLDNLNKVVIKLIQYKAKLNYANAFNATYKNNVVI